jgi:UDP-N-acetylmuramoylalanine--D-glutamate ligase
MKTTLVLGLGESGLACARWLVRQGGRVTVADTRAEPPLRVSFQAELPEVPLMLGSASMSWLDGVERMVISPGLAPKTEPIASLLAGARAAGIRVQSEIDVFMEALEDLAATRGYAPRIAGITGTNGKTTTTRMLAAMIARAGRTVRAAGNISPSVLDALRECLDEDRLPEFWVLELSSFQLASTSRLTCAAATVLNVTEDHLDWHVDMSEYAASKARIFALDTVRVLNRDDPRVMAMMADAATVWTFGTGKPHGPGQYGIVHEGGMAWLAATPAGEIGKKRRRGTRTDAPDASEEPLHIAPLMPLEALRVRGLHNATNAMAALALAGALGIALAPSLRALQAFEADAHRTQEIASIDGVAYYDDSKGTNVGATLAALVGLGATMAQDARIVPILGGDGKGQDFTPLRAPLAQYARAVVLIGRDAQRIADTLADQALPLHRATDMDEAVAKAASLARRGDLVLLSPACASLDMYRNYAHRAEAFCAAVQARVRHLDQEGT